MSRYPFTSYPNGWFVVAFSDELPIGTVLTRHYFGKDIVLFRTEDGIAHATDPYCPHLGAHLGHGGRIEGNTIRCPFHGWCFDSTGKCVSVPRLDKPVRASLSKLHLSEANGVIYVYHHVNGAEPDWQIPTLDEKGWTANKGHLRKIRTHAQEILENIVDIAHLETLHRVDNQRLTGDLYEERTLLRVQSIYQSPNTQTDVELDSTMHGLGMAVVVGNVIEEGIRYRTRFYPTPIDDEHIDLRTIVNIESMADPDMTEQVAQGYFQGAVDFLEDDLPIWENKRYVERPPFTKMENRPISVFRQWAQHFYSA